MPSDLSPLALPLWLLFVTEAYRVIKSGDAVQSHYGHYPTGHLVIGILAAAPIAFMLGYWIGQGALLPCFANQ